MRGKIIIESDNLFELLVQCNWEGLRSECTSSKGLVARFSFSGKAQLGILPRAHPGQHNPQLESGYLESTAYVCVHVGGLPSRGAQISGA